MRRYRIPAGAIRVPIPDATQQTDATCGASAFQAVCKYYGVGPDEEWEFVEKLGMDRRVGSHPSQIRKYARRLGLKVHEYRHMTIGDVKRELRLRHPVMLMIQAWGEERVNGEIRWRRDYSNHWKDGHWVVAIGYDKRGLFLEDPSLELIRGFLTYEEVEERWRDTGPKGVHMQNYGLAIWHPTRKSSAHTRWAAPIL